VFSVTVWGLAGTILALPAGLASTDGACVVMRHTGTTTTGDDASTSLASPVAPLLAGIPSRALPLLYASVAVSAAWRH